MEKFKKYLPFAFCGVVLILATIHYHYIKQVLYAEKKIELAQRNERVAQSIQYRFLQNSSYDLIHLSGVFDPLLKNTITNPLNYRLEALNWLKTVSSVYEASIAYLMDKNGNVVVSSNEDTPTSLTGKNYAFRPYFKEALEGKKIIYPAVGVTTNERGIYYASPVYKTTDVSKEIIGVLVIKAGLERIDKYFETFSDKLLLVTPENVVFSSNDPEFLFKKFDLTFNRQVVSKDVDNKQFSDQSSGLITDQVKPNGHDLLTYKKKKYFADEKVIPIGESLGREWKFIFLASQEKWIPTALFRAEIYISLIVILLILFYSFYFTGFTTTTTFNEMEVALANAIPLPFLVVDEYGEILYVHPRLKSSYSFTENLIIGKNFIKEIISKCEENSFSALDLVINTKQRVEKSIIIKDYGTINLFTGPYVINGQDRRVILFDRNKYVETTGIHPKDRAASPLNDARLILASQRLGQIGNELNTFYSSIKASIKKLKDSPEQKDQSITQIESVIEIINQIAIEMVKPTSLNFNSQTRFSIHTILIKNLDLSKPYFDQSGITIIRELNARDDLIIGSSTQIEQVLLNLLAGLSSYIKDADGGSLLVRTFNSAGTLYLDMKSTPSKKIEKKKEIIGITISKNIVAQMGGTLKHSIETDGALGINLEFPNIKEN